MQNLQKNFTITNQTPFDRVVYRGFLCCQVPGFEKPFYKLFENGNINTIIEIGTCQGGTTFFLNDLVKENYKNGRTVSVDISGFPWVEYMSKFGVEFIEGDAEEMDGRFLIICET